MGVFVGTGRFDFLAHEIGGGGSGEDLQMGVDQGTSRRWHVVPVDDVVDGFRVTGGC
jgi:hypothetical protein